MKIPSQNLLPKKLETSGYLMVKHGLKSVQGKEEEEGRDSRQNERRNRNTIANTSLRIGYRHSAWRVKRP